MSEERVSTEELLYSFVYGTSVANVWPLEGELRNRGVDTNSLIVRIDRILQAILKEVGE